MRQSNGQLQEFRRRTIMSVTDCVKSAINAGASTVAEIQAWALAQNQTVLSQPEVERTLKRVDEAWYRREVSARKRERGRARTLSDLLALAKERGYSPGWAYRVAASRGKR